MRTPTSQGRAFFGEERSPWTVQRMGRRAEIFCPLCLPPFPAPQGGAWAPAEGGILPAILPTVRTRAMPEADEPGFPRGIADPRTSWPTRVRGVWGARRLGPPGVLVLPERILFRPTTRLSALPLLCLLRRMRIHRQNPGATPALSAVQIFPLHRETGVEMTPMSDEARTCEALRHTRTPMTTTTAAPPER
jgi:hypothetical protein